MWRRKPGERLAGSLTGCAVGSMLLALVVGAPSAISQKAAVPLIESLPPGAMRAKATTSCMECHEARIILQQRLSKAGWTKEVDKMIKWGAMVDSNDHDALIDYLSGNFSPDQPPYEPPRTTPEGKKSK